MTGDENFLSRWSRRKIEARSAKTREEPALEEEQLPKQGSAIADPGTGASATQVPAPLPEVEKLTPESDFSPFMRDEVDPQTRSRALRQLFRDPHFSEVDMLDVYMEDFSLPDPLPEGWLEKLEQVAGLGDRAGRDREAQLRQERGDDGKLATDQEDAGSQTASSRIGDDADVAPGSSESASTSTEATTTPENPPLAARASRA